MLIKQRSKPKPRWASTRDTAQLLGVTSQTLLNLARQGRIPSPSRLNDRNLRWNIAEIEQAMEELRDQPVVEG